MYESFTDRAREVIQWANQEAKRLNHPYIGTEHILLGLVQGLAREGSNAAAYVWRSHGVNWRKVRREVERVVEFGPDEVTMGTLPQTPRAKKVIEYALEEARNLKHNYVGPEHLLLGLLREHESVAAQVLMNLGLKLEDVRKEVLGLLGMVREWRARHLPDPSWLTWQGGTVAAVARAIDTGGRWDELPVLADALEAAGCEDPEVLGHCRQPVGHGRGCWVVALLLNKV
jgi:hypothetical protein